MSTDSGNPKKRMISFRLPGDVIDVWREVARQVKADTGLSIGDLTALVLQQAARDLRAGRLVVRKQTKAYLQWSSSNNDTVAQPRRSDHARETRGGVPPG